ncbi:hypothetical protein [Actinomadura alba]|uniref:Transposase n=1 Tax=Actinomadura alba TaxID=406431 RepID=A0ABR7LTK7_9ACTN|nr:hypothetical protein [Actinomadura alba]MBC6467832.1 hypothetical protein [Actinomadura alba]
MRDVDLTAAADELYGVPPEEFVETRKRLAAEAKEAGDRELVKRIGALRRPTMSAWAINQLARSAPDELGWLSDVGADLRTEWAAGRHVGGLDQRRGELIDLLTRTARTLARDAGRPLREGAIREVEETLNAATMDPAVADEVRSGRLTQPRSHVGFIPAGVPAEAADRAGDDRAGDDLAERAQAETTQADRTRADRTRAERERERLAERARAAAAEAAEADRALAAHDAEADVAAQAHADLADEAERLRRRLDDVIGRRDAAMERLTAARRDRDRAADRAEKARRGSDEARRNLSGA